MPSPTLHTDRREKGRLPLYLARRRFPRVRLEVDWFLESDGCATLGRGLEISPRGAYLPVPRARELGARVTLLVSLPGRARLFKARAVASARSGPRGWVIRFQEVAEDDLILLAQTLIAEVGLGAVPGLARKYQRFTGLHQRFLRTSP